MLSRLTLSNFKNWRELDMRLAPITLLYGVNSAGKTGVLQSLLLLKQTAKGIDARQHINFGGGDGDYADFGSFYDLVYGHDINSHIGIGLTWELEQGLKEEFFPVEEHNSRYDVEQAFARYDISWRLNSGIYIEELAYEALMENQPELSLRLQRLEEDKYSIEFSDSFLIETNGDKPAFGSNSSEETEIVGSPHSCYILPFVEFPGQSMETLRVQPMYFCITLNNLISAFHYLGPLRQYPKRYYQWTGENKSIVVEPDGADTIATLVSSERDDKSLQQDVARWLNNLGLVDSLQVKSTDANRRFYEVSVKLDGVESALVDVGFGVSQVLPVVALLFSAPPGSIVLLEQPELHLHPNAQSLLADLLLHVAETRDLQLIVESHSEHVLRRLQARIAEGKSEFAIPENIKMYFCEPGEGGSTISEVELDRFGQIANWPEKFLGDISGELHTIAKAAISRRREELENHVLISNGLCPEYIKNRTKQT